MWRLAGNAQLVLLSNLFWFRILIWPASKLWLVQCSRLFQFVRFQFDVCSSQSLWISSRRVCWLFMGAGLCLILKGPVEYLGSWYHAILERAFNFFCVFAHRWGIVKMVQSKITGVRYALKCVRKKDVVEKGQQESLLVANFTCCLCICLRVSHCSWCSRRPTTARYVPDVLYQTFQSSPDVSLQRVPFFSKHWADKHVSADPFC